MPDMNVPDQDIQTQANAYASVQRDETPMLSRSPIVPPGNIAGQALSLVVAIMSFLACLTIGAVTLVDRSASAWQAQISREATVQIRPAEDFDIEAALEDTRAMVVEFEGVTGAQVISMPETQELLSPWLGAELDLSQLPVPRLVVVTIDENNPPDFAEMRAAISEAIPNATLDDHRAWVQRLVVMARTTTYVGVTILILMLAALILTVVFATRGALSGNQTIIEVLHFVGARAGFIARQFQARFFLIGLRGAISGGAAAIVCFFIVQFWASQNLTSAQGEQVASLFGDFSIGFRSIIGILMVVVLVACLTTITARVTVLRALYEIDERRADPSRSSY